MPGPSWTGGTTPRLPPIPPSSLTRSSFFDVTYHHRADEIDPGQDAAEIVSKWLTSLAQYMEENDICGAGNAPFPRNETLFYSVRSGGEQLTRATLMASGTARSGRGDPESDARVKVKLPTNSDATFEEPLMDDGDSDSDSDSDIMGGWRLHPQDSIEFCDAEADEDCDGILDLDCGEYGTEDCNALTRLAIARRVRHHASAYRAMKAKEKANKTKCSSNLRAGEVEDDDSMSYDFDEYDFEVLAATGGAAHHYSPYNGGPAGEEVRLQSAFFAGDLITPYIAALQDDRATVANLGSTRQANPQDTETQSPTVKSQTTSGGTSARMSSRRLMELRGAPAEAEAGGPAGATLTDVMRAPRRALSFSGAGRGSAIYFDPARASLLVGFDGMSDSADDSDSDLFVSGVVVESTVPVRCPDGACSAGAADGSPPTGRPASLSLNSFCICVSPANCPCEDFPAPLLASLGTVSAPPADVAGQLSRLSGGPRLTINGNNFGTRRTTFKMDGMLIEPNRDGRPFSTVAPAVSTGGDCKGEMRASDGGTVPITIHGQNFNRSREGDSPGPSTSLGAAVMAIEGLCGASSDLSSSRVRASATLSALGTIQQLATAFGRAAGYKGGSDNRADLLRAAFFPGPQAEDGSDAGDPAGARRSLSFRPEIGDEVIVGFLSSPATAAFAVGGYSSMGEYCELLSTLRSCADGKCPGGGRAWPGEGYTGSEGAACPSAKLDPVTGQTSQVSRYLSRGGPCKCSKRIDQTTPLLQDGQAGDNYTTCSCTHL